MWQSTGFAVFFSAANLIIKGLTATSEHQACYRIDGVALHNTFRCDNRTTGHSACCNPGEVCWSNGVCQGTTAGVEDWLREGCTDNSWNDPACFQVCPWSIGDAAIGVRPCGGIDQSNVYCCDDGSTGIGSFACCSNSSQTFEYNNITSLPTIIATMPLNDVPTTSSSTVTQSTLTESTPTVVPTESGTSSDASTNAAADASTNTSTNTSISTGLGAGLGVGLPVAAAIIGGVWWMIWRSKQQKSESEKGTQQNNPGNPQVPGENVPKPLFPLSSHEILYTSNPHELESGYEGRELPA